MSASVSPLCRVLDGCSTIVIVYEGLTIKPISCICSDAPDSSNRVRGLDDLSFLLVGEAV